jgi:hypothetical protein
VDAVLSALKVVRLLVALATCSLSIAPAVHAQTATLRGRVVDPDGTPLPNAAVEIVGTLWRTNTRADGSFDFALRSQEWMLRVRELGFLPESLTVSPPFEPMTVTLTRQPLALKGVTVTGAAAPPMARTVTASTVRQVPPVGEPDIFRAIVLLPAVSQPNDLKGRIHLAGGTSDETGVALDGHPLQDPFHLLGVLGAFNVAALDRADVMIHNLPMDAEGRLSGLIALQSRTSATPEREAVVSLLSTSLTAVEPHTIGGADVLASARITYLDRLIGAIGNRAKVKGDETPLLGYRDALLTVDRAFGNTGIKATSFYTRDRRPFGGGIGYDWGESLAGIRTSTRVGSWVFDSRASFNRASAGLGTDPGSGTSFQQFVALRHDWLSAEAGLRYFQQSWGWQAGLATDVRHTKQAWTGSPEDFFSPRTPRAYRGSQSQSRNAGFLEVTRALGTTSSVAVGARSTRMAARTFNAPRALLTRTLPNGARTSLSYSRRFQFDTELEEPSEGSGKQPLFLLDQPRMADVGAISVSRTRESGEWEIASFYKRYRDRTSLQGNPRAFMDSTGVLPDSFPAFDRIRGRSYGATASVTRQLGSRSLIQASYTFQRVSEEIKGAYTPTEWDAPHSVIVFATTPISRKWSFNIVSQWHSGAAATPAAERIFAPDADLSPFLQPRYLGGERNSGRLASYRRMDVGVRRESKRGKTEIAFSAQVLNIFAHRNSLEYDWASAYCTGSNACKTDKPTRAGLPIIPSLGLEIRW